MRVLSAYTKRASWFQSSSIGMVYVAL